MNKKISPLTRNELAKELMSETGSYSDAYQFIGKFFDVLSDEITNRGHVKVHGFGVFRCLQKKARIGRNPKTGEVAKITRGGWSVLLPAINSKKLSETAMAKENNYPSIPTDKRCFTIGEAARLSLSKPHILRYWEKEVPALSRQSRGAAIVDITAVKRWRHYAGYIYWCRKKSYTIAGARRALQGGESREDVARFYEFKTRFRTSH